MLRNMLTYGKLKMAAKTNEIGNLKTRQHEKKTLLLTLKLLDNDPMIESKWTGKGLLAFEDVRNEWMAKGVIASTKKGRPPGMRKAAIILLGEMRISQYLKHLFSIAQDKENSKELRLEAVRSIGKIDGEESLEFLMNTLWKMRELRGEVLMEAINRSGGSIVGKEME